MLLLQSLVFAKQLVILIFQLFESLCDAYHLDLCLFEIFLQGAHLITLLLELSLKLCMLTDQCLVFPSDRLRWLLIVKVVLHELR